MRSKQKRKPSKKAIVPKGRKGSRKKKVEPKPNALRGETNRVHMNFRIDSETDTQLREWSTLHDGLEPCSKGMGDLIDKVVKFAKKKKFDPCKK